MSIYGLCGRRLIDLDLTETEGCKWKEENGVACLGFDQVHHFLDIIVEDTRSFYAVALEHVHCQRKACWWAQELEILFFWR